MMGAHGTNAGPGGSPAAHHTGSHSHSNSSSAASRSPAMGYGHGPSPGAAAANNGVLGKRPREDSAGDASAQRRAPVGAANPNGTMGGAWHGASQSTSQAHGQGQAQGQDQGYNGEDADSDDSEEDSDDESGDESLAQQQARRAGEGGRPSGGRGASGSGRGGRASVSGSDRHASGSGSGSSSKVQKACVSCRRAKTRCVNVGSQPPCERCAAMKQVCKFRLRSDDENWRDKTDAVLGRLTQAVEGLLWQQGAPPPPQQQNAAAMPPPGAGAGAAMLPPLSGSGSSSSGPMRPPLMMQLPPPPGAPGALPPAGWAGYAPASPSASGPYGHGHARTGSGSAGAAGFAPAGGFPPSGPGPLPFPQSAPPHTSSFAGAAGHAPGHGHSHSGSGGGGGLSGALGIPGASPRFGGLSPGAGAYSSGAGGAMSPGSNAAPSPPMHRASYGLPSAAGGSPAASASAPGPGGMGPPPLAPRGAGAAQGMGSPAGGALNGHGHGPAHAHGAYGGAGRATSPIALRTASLPKGKPVLHAARHRRSTSGFVAPLAPGSAGSGGHRSSTASAPGAPGSGSGARPGTALGSGSGGSGEPSAHVEPSYTLAQVLKSETPDRVAALVPTRWVHGGKAWEAYARPAEQIGRDDPRLNAISMGFLPMERARQLFVYFAEHHYPHSFGFPTYPASENMTPVIISGLLAVAALTEPNSAQYHDALRADFLGAVKPEQAPSLSVEQELDPEMGIGVEEITGACLFASWIGGELGWQVARVAKWWTIGYLRLFSKRSEETLGEALTILPPFRNIEESDRLRIFLMAYITETHSCLINERHGLIENEDAKEYTHELRRALVRQKERESGRAASEADAIDLELPPADRQLLAHTELAHLLSSAQSLCMDLRSAMAAGEPLIRGATPLEGWLATSDMLVREWDRWFHKLEHWRLEAGLLDDLSSSSAIAADVTLCFHLARAFLGSLALEYTIPPQLLGQPDSVGTSHLETAQSRMLTDAKMSALTACELLLDDVASWTGRIAFLPAFYHFIIGHAAGLLLLLVQRKWRFLLAFESRRIVTLVEKLVQAYSFQISIHSPAMAGDLCSAQHPAEENVTALSRSLLSVKARTTGFTFRR